MKCEAVLTTQKAPVQLLEALAKHSASQEQGLIARLKRSAFVAKGLDQVSWQSMSPTRVEGQLTGFVANSLKRSNITISVTTDGNSLLYEIAMPTRIKVLVWLAIILFTLIPPFFFGFFGILFVILPYGFTARRLIRRIHGELEALLP